MLRSLPSGATKFTALVGFLILASGCASDAQNVYELQESPSFQVGYGDGCISSTEADKSFSTETKRDTYAFENDDAYRSGWRQGFFQCSSQIPDPNDGGRITGERDELF